MPTRASPRQTTDSAGPQGESAVLFPRADTAKQSPRHSNHIQDARRFPHHHRHLHLAPPLPPRAVLPPSVSTLCPRPRFPSCVVHPAPLVLVLILRQHPRRQSPYILLLELESERNVGRRRRRPATSPVPDRRPGRLYPRQERPRPRAARLWPRRLHRLSVVRHVPRHAQCALRNRQQWRRKRRDGKSQTASRVWPVFNAKLGYTDHRENTIGQGYALDILDFVCRPSADR